MTEDISRRDAIKVAVAGAAVAAVGIPEAEAAHGLPPLTGIAPIRAEGESERDFMQRHAAYLGENPGYAFAITREGLNSLGIDGSFFQQLPYTPNNVFMWLDSITENILVMSLPKGMDIFKYLEAARKAGVA